MSNLYKYFNIEILNGFIDYPTLKLTKPNELNDPFESKISEEIINIHNDITRKRCAPDLTIADLQWIARNMGIISLTKSQDNKLMWAHYANSHSGFVVGFDTKMLSKYISSIKSTAPAVYPSPKKLHKVKYRTRRFNCNSLTKLNIDNLDEFKFAKHLITEISTIKSTDWKYENEYRYILSPDFCDSIRITVKTNSIYFNKALKIITENFKVKRNHFYDSIKNVYLDIDGPFCFKDEITSTQRVSVLNELDVCKPTRLMAIPKECITSIQFGVEVAESTITNLIYKLNEYPEYHNVEIIKYHPCNKTFGLNPEIKDKIRPLPSSEEINDLFIKVEQSL
ncbi:DUF2971 domain-containing protein [Aeromonas veronii]|uniref:DUF2971 domain-containing protein n=1 Tax=Aeromonas veronii TaxID=654 RepID=UPI00227BB906|nr:DUF2971 domain-containing protein [Aeromonas veronii]